MKQDTLHQTSKYSKAHQRKRRWYKAVSCLAVVVVFCTTYALILPAITMERDAKCGIPEHVHDESCYIVVSEPHVHDESCYELVGGHAHTDDCYTLQRGELICGQEEREGHHHTDACYTETTTLVCGLEEDENHQHTAACYETTRELTCGLEESGGHQHTDECYAWEQVLTCGQEESEGQLVLTCNLKEGEVTTTISDTPVCGLEEHTHTHACYSDPAADVETAQIWERAIKNVELTGDWREDVIAIAKTQLGYQESAKNYIVLEDGETIKGYTRYGAWYGDPYGDWCAMFASFVLNYAEVEGIPLDANCQHWIETLSKEENDLYRPADEYLPQPGDLVFFDFDIEDEEEKDEAPTADHDFDIEDEEEKDEAPTADHDFDIEDEEEKDEAPTADHVGLVVELMNDEDENPIKLKTIEGDSSDKVQYVTYELDDPAILGYGQLPEQEPEDEEPIEEPAEQFVLTAESEDGIAVTVTGDPESLPYPVEEITLSVQPVTDEDVIALWKQTVEEAGENAEEAFLLDIALLHDGEEIEPAGPVQVTFEGVETGDNDELTVFHVDAENEETEDMNAVVDEAGTVVLDTDHFSTYGGVLRTPLKAPNTAGNDYIYFEDDSNWDVVYLYNWMDDDHKTNGPEVPVLKHDELSRAWGKNIYYVSANSLEYDNVIFTNQNGWNGLKTVDLIGIKTEADSNPNLCYVASEVEQGTQGADVTTHYTLQTNLAGMSLYFDKSAFEEATISIEGGEQNVSLSTVADDDEVLSYTFPTDSTANWNTTITVTKNGQSITFQWTEWTKDLVTKFQSDPTMETYVKAEEITTADQLKAFLQSPTAKKARLKNGITFDFGVNNTVTGDKILDLNGNGLYYTGTGDALKVENGNSLTIRDSQSVEPSSEQASGDNYGHTATVGWDGNKPQTLEYYVTETSASGITTSESLVKYTATARGFIVAENSNGAASVVKVESGGTFNLEGGMLTMKNSDSYSDSYSGGDAHIIMNAGTVNLEGGYVCGGQDTGWGGGIYSSGTINMTGGVVAANAGQSGGGICVNGGTMNMSGGVISGNWTNNSSSNIDLENRAYDGGGVYVNNGGTLNLSGGYITNNYKSLTDANDSYNQHGGGGVAIDHSSTMNMTGGYVTGNQSEDAAGGIFAGYRGNSNFRMTGGIIASNFANHGEGGGLRVGAGTNAIIDASSGGKIYITNNKTNDNKDWGGGGIFIQQNGNLNILDVLVTNNHAGGFGGGVAGCPTADVSSSGSGINDRGAAIFGNQADVAERHLRRRFNYKDFDRTFWYNFVQAQHLDWTKTARDYFGTGYTNNISSDMLGGGNAEWRDPLGNSTTEWIMHVHEEHMDESGNVYEILDADIKVAPLTSNATPEDREKAIEAARVFITGNYSWTNGGGIMSNGVLDMGKHDTTTTPATLTLKATKRLEDTDGSVQALTNKQFSFVLLNREPQWDDPNGRFIYDDSMDIMGAENDKYGNIQFRDMTFIVDGTYTYYLIEQPVNDTSITQDPVLYKIVVTVTADETLVNDVRTTTYNISNVEVSKGGSVIQTYSSSTTTKTTVEIPKQDGKAAFINKKAVPYSLPSTGSTGTTPYTTGGLLLMVSASALLLYNHQKRRKEATASS